MWYVLELQLLNSLRKRFQNSKNFHQCIVHISIYIYLEIADSLNSTQRDRNLLPGDRVFTSSHGQVVDEC